MGRKGKRDLPHYTDQPELVVEKPKLSGLHFKRPSSLPSLRASSVSFDCPDFFGTALNSRPFSPEISFIEALSEPIFGTQTVRLKRRLKKLKPKLKSDFVKGRICRWEDISKKTKIKNKTSVLNCVEQDSDREGVKANAILKVYARDRTKKFSRNNLKPKMTITELEEAQELELESDLERNNQLTHKPEISSNTYSSDSDETFLSERAMEEDLDL